MSAVASEILYDVFLSYSPGGGEDAVRRVRATFSESGLKVFDASQLSLGVDLQDQVWSALAVSDAIVVLATPSTVSSAWTAVEIGAAQAWQKPVFIVTLTPPAADLPEFISRFPIVPMARLDDVVQAIRERQIPLATDEREPLRETYLEMGIPVDRLLTSPPELALFAQRFNRRNHSAFAAEALAQKLLKMRKRGDLPRLKRGSHAGE